MSTAAHSTIDHDGVVLVGTGAVNLVTGIRLSRLGVPLLMVDAGPDPRLPGPRSQACTMGGCDGRIVSLNESRHHFLKPTQDMGCTQFDRTIADGGWLGVPPQRLRDSDREWIAKFRDVSPLDYRRLNDHLIGCNRHGLARWRQLISELPDLFEGITVERLLRVYLNPAAHAAGVEGERAIGAFISELSADEIDAELGAMAEYGSRSYLGAIRVQGFGINVHGFVCRSLSRLEQSGTRFIWNTEVAEVAMTPGGEFSGLVTGDGSRISGTHVVISPGVPRPNTLLGMPSRELLAGVAGGWLTLPNDGRRLETPIKLTRDGFAADESSAGANIIPGRAPDGSPVIHISSGHAYVGADLELLEPEWQADLARVLHDTARQLFPGQYATGRERGLVVPGRLSRVCVRPWTPSCAGVFDDQAEGPGGRLLVTGGHNTGGFAQAPAVADAVSEWIDGSETSVRDSYFPRADVAVGAR
ncbi:FAD-dependent oxidoreductase [Cellulomonas cellasea]|uniref:FAD dependent oxidoreductase domain-containing protein n=2 Tax=Cellulomonas cellasea TaxID=43670 RepID=A0A0A0BDA9_9CELL|nr:FAD-dependent oxidoreductase [Cellulomonas cellasea]KGM03889.1 hypothetical protein Q760_07805 [Cellulomonas cellasea DSM 20118]GEA87336.1 hypothetical protein CCE01nite_12850 [Cellulomonas cellasea]